MTVIFCSLPVPRSLAVDVHDAVGVDVEGDLDLRHAARGRRQTGQLEHAELLVVRRDLALALVDLDLHGRLVVLGGGEDLGALGRDRRVPLDELGHDAALARSAAATGTASAARRRARRQIDDQIIQLRPIGVVQQQLLERPVRHRPAPDQRLVLLDQRADRDRVNAVHVKRQDLVARGPAAAAP